MSYYQMGNMYYNLGDVDASINAYTEFLKEVPDGSDLKILAYNGIGYCYEKKADLPHALESFEKAANAKSGGGFEGMTYRNMARIYEEMNNKEKALEYYQKALSNTADPSMATSLEKNNFNHQLKANFVETSGDLFSLNAAGVNKVYESIDVRK